MVRRLVLALLLAALVGSMLVLEFEGLTGDARLIIAWRFSKPDPGMIRPSARLRGSIWR